MVALQTNAEGRMRGLRRPEECLQALWNVDHSYQLGWIRIQPAGLQQVGNTFALARPGHLTPRESIVFRFDQTQVSGVVMILPKFSQLGYAEGVVGQVKP